MSRPLEEYDPREIGPYAVLGRLGAGGMGQVYLGQAPDGARCAVKVIHPGLAQDEQFRARFGREVALARQVRGPHLARLLAADLGGPLPWLATEYVPGESLEEVVTARGPLPEDDVRAMAAELFAALAAVHATGVVHRDIKPSNILLGAEGATLIDFGIAHAVDSTRITRTGMVIGSPAFMSPEQAAGGDVGAASDVFALAAVLVFASTGVGPFGTGSPAALLLRAADTDPRLDDVPDALRPVVQLCLAKDPSARPSAAVLAATLPTGAPARGDVERPPFRGEAAPAGGRPGGGSRRTGWLIAAGVVVAIVAAATVVAIRSGVGTGPSIAAPPPTPCEISAHPTELTFADEVHDVAFSPDSRRAFVAHGAGLDVVDTATDTVSSMVSMADPVVVAISPDGTRAYVGLGSGYIQVLDTTAFRTLGSITTDGFPVGIAISADGRRLYVASQEVDVVAITVADTATNAVIHTVTVEGDGPTALAMSGDGSLLFVRTMKAVAAIATSDDSVVMRKPADSPAIAPAPGGQAYTIEAVGGTLTVLDGSGSTKPLPAPRSDAIVTGLVSTADGRQLYLLRDSTHEEGGSTDRLELVDPATGRTTTTIVLDEDYNIPVVRVSPDGRQVYVISFMNPSVDVLDIPDHE